MTVLSKRLDDRFRPFYISHAPLVRLKSLMKKTRSGVKLPHPWAVFIESTNICNYKCPKCPQTTGLGRSPAKMDLDLYRDIIDQLKSEKLQVALHHSGEPMLHPQIFEMIDYSRNAGLETVIVTNASLLDKEDFRIATKGPDTLVMSVDGASSNVYEPAHGGVPWEKIKSNIEEFFRRLDPAAPTRNVQISMVVVSQKPDEIQEFQQFAQRFPFLKVMIKPVLEWPDGKQNIPVPEFPPEHWVYPCRHPWLSPAILADGAVVPCCMDAFCLYPAGNIKEKPFIEIFNGERLNRLRNHLLDLNNTPPLPLCDSCGFKRQSIPLSRRGRIVFKTLPYWKHLLRDLP